MSSKANTPEKFNKMINEMYPNKYTILSDYTKSNEHIKIRYNKCGHIAEPKAAYIRQGAGCPICNSGKKLTEEEFYKRFHEVVGNEYSMIDEYVNTKQNAEIIHNVCGTIFTRNVGVIINKKECKCPKCNPSSAVKLVQGVNDVYTVNQELASLFLDPSDSRKYTSYSKYKASFKCPECGNIIIKPVFQVATNGLCCSNCNMNYSYGERFVSNLLQRVGVNFIHEYSPKWIKPYRYDFMFKYKQFKYIVEIDGGYHFSISSRKNETIEDIQEIDKLKQMRAERHNFIVIRLNYNYSYSYPRFERIRDSIKESLISVLFELSDYDYNEINTLAEKSLITIVANMWNSMEDKALIKICNHLHMSDTRLREILYRASDIGLVKETRGEIRLINRRYGNKVYGHNMEKKVKCNETGEIFNSIKEANYKYSANVGAYLSGTIKNYTGKLSDGTHLTWQVI